MEKMSSGDMWRDCLEVRTDGRGFQKGLVFYATFISSRPCENNWSPQIPILTVVDCQTVPWHEKNLSPSWTWKPKTLIVKYTCTPIFIAAVFTVTKTCMQCKCASAEEWRCAMCIQWNISHTKDEILPLAATSMYLGGIMLSEVSQRKANVAQYYWYFYV